MNNDAVSVILDYFHGQASDAPSADQLLRSIDDLQELLSRAPAPAAMIEEFDLVACAVAIVEILNLASGKRVPQISLEAPPPSLLVAQDRGVFEQMLTRVLDTAAKFAEATTIPLHVRIASRKHGVHFAIRICEAALAVRLGHWLNANPDGMSFLDPSEVPFGLALMVAGKRLRALGGAAEFDGDSAVCLDLPSYAPGAQSAGSGGLLVMVVEDSDESFALTRMVLEEQQVLRARDGNAALRLFERRRFDVVFMDVHMPGMDGYEAIRRMRDWETRTGSPRTPMVVLSSDDLETQQRSAAEFGCSGFLRKPLQQWDLMPLLERLK